MLEFMLLATTTGGTDTGTLHYLAGNLVPLMVAVAVPAGTYLAVRRRLAGRITSSEAKDLWAESSAIRQEQREVERQLRADILGLHAENAQLRHTMNQTSIARDECLKRLDQALRGTGPKPV